MENERTLSYQMSQKLTQEEIQHVSGAGITYGSCTIQTGGPGGPQLDWTRDSHWDE